MEGAMPWDVARAKNIPRVEYDHRAREARLALERLERAFVAPPAASPLRLALRGERPCRDADMGSENFIWRTATIRGGAEISGSRVRHARIASRHRRHAADNDSVARVVSWAPYPCGLAGMRGGGASSRTRKLPLTASA